MPKLIVNITTETGELLKSVEVKLTGDPRKPLGPFGKPAIGTEIESAARIVLARKAA